MQNNYRYSTSKKIPDDHIRPTKKFINEISKYFTVIKFTRKGKTIETTSRTNRYRQKIVQLRVNSNLENHTHTIYGIRYAVRKNKVELQTYRFVREIIDLSNPKEIISVKLVNLVRTTKGNPKPEVIRTAQLANLGWQAIEYSENQNIYKLFKNNYLKYIKNHIPDLTRIYAREAEKMLIRIHKYQRHIEILANMGNSRLISDIIRGHEDMRVITLNYLKREQRWLKMGLIPNQINELEYIKKYYKLNPSTINRIKYNDLDVYYIESILEYEKNNGISSRKLLRYLDKQGRCLYYYRDYINLKREIGDDLSYWSYMFPKDLEKAHDQVAERVREAKRAKQLLKEKKQAEAYERKVKLLKRIEVRDDNYSILIPETLDEIYQEGKELNHCVYSDHYLKKHANESLIVFVRKSSELENPYFTAELNAKGKLVQLHGYGNESKTEKGEIAKAEKPEVESFVKSQIESKEFQNKYLKIVEKTFDLSA